MTRTCPHCGATFRPRRRDQRYCDASCQIAAAQRAYALRQRAERRRIRALVRAATL